MTFDEAFVLLFGHEGGYVNDPQDPGGETKFGISKRSYPKADIKNLTIEQAKAIALPDFWVKAGCDRLPDAIRFDVFDMAFNSGPGQAVLALQRAVGVSADGRLGDVTLAAARALPAGVLISRFNGQRLKFLTDLANWPRAGKGWARRVAANLLRA